MKLHRQAHVVYKTQYHLVWVTRYRRKILVPGIAEYLKKVLRTVREFHPDWFLEEIGVERDHVHLHMVIPPKYAVSRVVEILKSITSRQLKEKFTHVLSKVYWDGGGGWARGFFPSTVGINEATIRHYVQHQGEQETGQAQLDLQLFEGLPVHLAVRMVLEIAAPLAMILGTQKFRHVAEYTGNPPMHTAYCQFTPKSPLIERHERWPLSPRESPTHRS